MKHRVFGSLKLGLNLTFRGKWTVRVLTVLLSAVSFLFFALTSMGYFYDRDDLFLRGYRHYLSDHAYVYIENGDQMTDHGFLPLQDVLAFETGLPLPYIRLYPMMIDADSCVEVQYYRGPRRENGFPDYDDPAYHEYQKFMETRPFIGSEYCCVASPSALEKLGVRLVEGRYPQAENEIAVPKEFLEPLVRGGYVNAVAENCFSPHQQFGSNGEMMTFYISDPVYNPPPRAESRVEIATYADLIGKTFPDFGESKEMIATGHFSCDVPPSEAVVTGVLDFDGMPDWDYIRLVFLDRIVRSEAWAQAQDEKGVSCVEGMITKNELTDRQISTLLQLSGQAAERARERYRQDNSDADPSIGAYYTNSLLSLQGSGGFGEFALLFGGIGLFFLIFSVLLNVHLMDAMVELKRKQIGTLRALGGSRGGICALYAVGAVALAALIFVLSALLLTVTYFTFWKDVLYIRVFGVSLVELNVWSFLFLAAISFSVPVLASLIPVRRFLKRPIVEIIRGNGKTTRKAGKDKEKEKGGA